MKILDWNIHGSFKNGYCGQKRSGLTPEILLWHQMDSTKGQRPKPHHIQYLNLLSALLNAAPLQVRWHWLWLIYVPAASLLR